MGDIEKKEGDESYWSGFFSTLELFVDKIKKVRTSPLPGQRSLDKISKVEQPKIQPVMPVLTNTGTIERQVDNPKPQPINLESKLLDDNNQLDIDGIDHFDEILSKESFDRNRLVIVEFGAPWCGYCKTQKKDLEKLASSNKNVLFLKVNIDNENNLGLKSTYGVGPIPHLIMFKSKQVVDQLVGNPRSFSDLKSRIIKRANS